MLTVGCISHKFYHEQPSPGPRQRVFCKGPKKYSRKGKLNEKKIHERQLTLKNIHAMAYKNSNKEFDKKKIPAARKLPPPPPPHTFSNGPSLRTQKGVIVSSGPSGDRGNWG